MDVNNLCVNCMNENTEGEKVCPHCGFVMEENPAPPHQLPYYTVLNGKYMVGRAIGEGGFGITYIGWDLNLGIKVAIKEFYPEGFVGRDGQQSYTVRSYQGNSTVFFNKGKDKFLEEARSLGKFMQLPGIVSVKDFFLQNNTVYIVMEYLEGISLKAYAKEKGGKVEKDELLEIMRPVLESLIEVHKSGIIHRDISPDNIMICKDKQVKLIDFGAARETSPQGEKTLSVMLKKGYSPEEQYRTHGEQGTWTDVYALSATIYTMLTGVKPDEPLDRMENETLQPLSKMGVELTRRQEDVIMKGLAIKASDRVQTIEELYRGLYRDGKDNEFAMRKKRKWKLGAMIATLLVVGCASACVLAYRMIPVKPAAVICYEAQVNQDVQAGDLQEYLPEGAQEIRFSMGDVLSNHLMINNMPESGDAYELEVQYEQGGRQFIQQLEVSVKAPLVSALVPKVTCEAGQKIADYTPYFQVQNGEHLNLTITDNTNSETAGVQEVTATLQSGEYAFATASLQVDYYDMQLEKEKLLTLLQEYKQGTLKEDKDMKNCAEKFMEQAVSMEFGAQWSTVLQTCSDAVIGAYPKVSYTEAMAVPVYGRADQINYSAEAFYQELIQNENFTTLLASTEKIGIAAQTVYGEKQMAVYWCIYCK